MILRQLRSTTKRTSLVERPRRLSCARRSLIYRRHTSQGASSRNELRFIRQTQQLEDVGAKLIAISTRYKAPDESVDDSFYQTTKYTTDGILNEQIAGKSI